MAMNRLDYPELVMRTRRAWRQWLAKNHAKSRGVWFVHFHKGSGEQGVGYHDCVEEALCFGWIDSTVRKLEPPRYAHLLTPRRDSGNWSASNLERMRKLIAARLVTKAGMAVFKPEPVTAQRTRPIGPGGVPAPLRAALAGDPLAKAKFAVLAKSYQRQFSAWIANAKHAETRARRLTRALALIRSGRKSPFFS